ncbi:hypothetical protein [Clostridium tyrobutyricum]|uniref:hypothetical protein n=1 Tax=Clostridium tyrobutyricum TaxID=1519 RepID=UPI001C395893|nr:hypothetical protein [Clostridium tyrobutyricum]MBV4429085.1 hypothetical protein [Clostridium tyrobutyricum]MBV4444162.1 hypothetical protein [Clostridium tyrobutyricum]
MGIILRDGTTEILNMDEIQNFMENFRTQIEATEKSIAGLESQIQTSQNKRRSLIEQSMLVAGDEFKPSIQEEEAKISNFENMLSSEKEKLELYKDILEHNTTFNNLLKETSDQIATDLHTYVSIDEKDIFMQMAKLRNQYETLFAELHDKRGAIQNDVYEFNGICEKYGRPDLKKGAYFHENLRMVNPAVPEAGIVYPPVGIPLRSSQAIKDIFDYARRGIERF